MTEEVSEYTMVAVVLCFIAAFMTSIIGITVMSVNVINNTTDKYSFNLTTTPANGLLDLTMEEEVPGPIIYTSIDQSLELIHSVELVGAPETVIYTYNLEQNNLVILMSKYNRQNFKVSIDMDNKTRLYRIVLEVK